ncbi:MAG: methionyl-tRNA formyltransferase [Oscillospiraceae bacterium]|nr:methionyl-tRNA formyltransferase [Oscillospiraceae bacterium]
MNIIFMGTPDFAEYSLRKLSGSKHKILAVFTQPDRPAGRGYKLVPSAVKTAALELGFEVFQPDSPVTEHERLSGYKPDAIVVVAYGKLLPEKILNIPKYGCVNLHGSLLPEYRGAAPIQWNIINGGEYGGTTTMLMDEGMDTGDILLQEKTKIGDEETAGELFERLKVSGAYLLSKTLDKLENGDITPQKQDEAAATYAPKITGDMCLINFEIGAKSVQKLICGLSPGPGAYTLLNGKKLKILRARVADSDVAGIKKTVGAMINKNGRLIIPCVSGAVEATEIQYEGSRRMSAAEFINGHKNLIYNA